MDQSTLIAVLFSVCGLLAGVAGTLAMDRLRGAEAKGERATEEGGDNARLIAVLEALTATRAVRQDKHEDRQMSAMVDMAEIATQVRTLWGERGQCEGMAARLAVLEDARGASERRLSVLDQLVANMARLESDVRTLFTMVKESPDRVADRVFETLKDHIRAPHAVERRNG